MRLKKSYDDKKLVYTLSFEISPTELIAAGGANAWKSQYMADYIEMLQKIAGAGGMTGRTAKKKRRFEDILREAQQEQQQAQSNFFNQSFNQAFNQQQYSQGFGTTSSTTRTPPRARMGQDARCKSYCYQRRDQSSLPHTRQRKPPRPRWRSGQVCQNLRSIRAGH